MHADDSLSGIADEIAIGLLRSKSLDEIYLGGNPWSDDDIQAFSTAFVTSKDIVPHITKLSFGEHRWITKETAQVGMATSIA